MQINAVNGPALPPVEPRRQEVAEKPGAPTDQADFELNHIEKALAEQPDVRADEVARGRELFNNVRYPPAELIRSISRLVASYGKDPRV